MESNDGVQSNQAVEREKRDIEEKGLLSKLTNKKKSEKNKMDEKIRDNSLSENPKFHGFQFLDN
jgi:hypothetical protein